MSNNRMTPGQIHEIRDRNREDMHQALTIKDLAFQLNCSEKTARELVKRGEIRAFRVGGIYRVLPADLDRYIEAQMETA
jgi:excisionase family DNA binding protein